MNLDVPYPFLDLDWFFIDIEGRIAHAASGGGKLPVSISQNYPYDFLLTFFKSLPSLGDPEVNPRLEKYVTFRNDKERKQYLASFIQMAQRGLYSFDKSDVTRTLDGRYHLVASPKIKLSIAMLPPEVASQLSITKINRRIEEINSLEVSEVA
ncbi:hypothetical protein SAMN04488109_4438 [Chryseolinea serpens]|uniref:Uncharacterized protein n=1 Tax=Chryseolinea serpens TaxID=947013 RepID=A0A1M5U3F0_9BACT|nr:hypothetical protein [Chryseolinea serpens]SHH57547.1 hypothetical protein SAMN04488109_4438 [Chryseolinea serpens]